MFMFAMSYHMDILILIKNYLLIISNMGVCSQLIYKETDPQMPTWYLSLWRLGASCTKHVFVWLIPMCKMFPNWYEILQDIQMQHVLNIYYWNFYLGVNPCGMWAVVAPLPQIAKLPITSQNNGFKICEMIWVGMSPLFSMRVIFCHLEMIWVEVR